MQNLNRPSENEICKNYKLNRKKGGSNNPPYKSKKLNFKVCKKNTICSLNEVEHFLRNFNSFIKYIKLYKILK